MNNQGDVLYTIFQLLVIISCLLLLLWVFYPAILIRQSNSKPKQKNTFSDFNGIIEEDNQIQKSSKCDLSLVVPAYNEVPSFHYIF